MREPVAAPNPVVFLARYGLDAVLTDDDDPGLWAAVVGAHWPPPGDPSLNAPGLSFGLAYSYDPPWTFARVGPYALRVVESVDPADAPRGLRAPRLRRFPYLSIRIERPSAGKDRALVDTGRTLGFLAGQGETRVWEKVPEAREGPDEAEHWRPTDEVVSSWRS